MEGTTKCKRKSRACVAKSENADERRYRRMQKKPYDEAYIASSYWIPTVPVSSVGKITALTGKESRHRSWL